MPTLPVDQSALTSTSPSIVVKPFARPFSHSMTALGPSFSFVPPTVGQPCERPVPGDSECTTANPRGTHVLTSLVEIEVRFGLNVIHGGDVRAGGAVPSSWLTFHRYCAAVLPVPA